MAFSAFGAAMVCVPLWQVLQGHATELRHLQAERQTLDPVALAVSTQRGLLRHRPLAARWLGGETEVATAREQARQDTDAALQGLGSVLASGAWGFAQTEARALSADWQQLAQQVQQGQLTVAQSDDAHSLRVEQVLQVVDLLAIGHAPAGSPGLPARAVATGPAHADPGPAGAAWFARQARWLAQWQQGHAELMDGPGATAGARSAVRVSSAVQADSTPPAPPAMAEPAPMGVASAAPATVLALQRLQNQAFVIRQSLGAVPPPPVLEAFTALQTLQQQWLTAAGPTPGAAAPASPTAAADRQALQAAWWLHHRQLLQALKDHHDQGLQAQATQAQFRIAGFGLALALMAGLAAAWGTRAWRAMDDDPIPTPPLDGLASEAPDTAADAWSGTGPLGSSLPQPAALAAAYTPNASRVQASVLMQRLRQPGTPAPAEDWPGHDGRADAVTPDQPPGLQPDDRTPR